MKNGDRLTGTINEYDGSKLTLDTKYAGTLKLPAEDVTGIATEGPVTIRIMGVGWTTGHLVMDRPGTIRVVRDGREVTGPVAVSKVNRLAQGREVPLGFVWKGHLNVGGVQRSGNTDNKSFHLDTGITGRAEEDRIRVRGEFNREFDDGSRTVDNFDFGVQHDHFLTKKVFFYTKGALERDTPSDLRLRTSVGTGGGYQFIETPETKLSFQAGPAYIHEDFDTSPDHDYVAMQWNVEYEQDLLRGMATLFHHHEGTVDTEDTQNMFIDSSTGIRVPVANRLNATAQVDLDWDRDPAPGVSSLDKTYLLTVGYSW